MAASKLEEVDPQSIPGVLEILKQDWPRNIHIYGFIWMQLEWERKKALSNIKLYCCDGKLEEGIFIAISAIPGKNMFCNRVMLHSRVDDRERLRKLLLESNCIDCSTVIIFEAVFEDDIPIVEEFCSLNNLKCYYEGIFNQVVLPLKNHDISVKCPDGTYLEKLRDEHVKIVNETWKYGTPNTEEMVAMTINTNFGIGLFQKSTNKLLAWNTVQHFAALGMLFTDELERGKGYAKVVTAALAKELVERNIHPFACIRENNNPSMAVYTKLGFEIADRVTWIAASYKE